ncbi:MAG: response regulator [Spirochaetales bacterium]|nr:response regulator [Spirochaetales bacterium]
MGNKASIMVVEDAYIVAKDLQDSLSELGYYVTGIASTGKEAIQIASQNRPDLILMDVKLKGQMDGIEAAEVIRDFYDIPVIYLTAYVDNHTLERAKRTEPVGYIVKPFKKEELHSTIEMALYKRKMESYLKKREEMMSTTLNSISDVVITTDEAGLITYMNPVAEKLSGWTQEEVISKNLVEVIRIVDEKTGIPKDNPVQRILTEGLSFDISGMILNHKSRAKRAVIGSSSPIKDASNTVLGVVLTLRDITEQKRLQTELLKANRLESISKLAGSIGHEFNNLLTVIMGTIDLVKESNDWDDKMLGNLDQALAASKKAKNLTSQLLNFSDSEEIKTRACDAKSFMENTLKKYITTENIDIHYDIAQDIWNVDIDENQISQSIVNVLKSIFFQVPLQGQLLISMQNVETGENPIFLDQANRYVKILINRPTVLLDHNFIEQIFDPSFGSANKPYGLELASSYSIFKKHGGHVSVESNQTTGSSLFIYLPASKQEVPKTRKRARRGKESKRRILVMDDQELVRIIVGKMLSHLGYEVEFSRHGDETIELYKLAQERQQPFDCVILDLTIEMGMGGKETIKQLLKIDDKVNAIVSTGYSNDPVIYNYNELGFKSVITKPYELEELRRIVRESVEDE